MLRLRSSQLKAIHEHAAKAYPQECCGIFIGNHKSSDAIVEECRPALNINHERAHDRYLIDPKDLLKAEKDARGLGQEVLGYYHSHPDHPASASATDSAQSWESYVYLIVSVRNGVPAEMAAYVRDAGASVGAGVKLIPQDLVILP
jgi:proteasome lid subunit RPN8/RPN11